MIQVGQWTGYYSFNDEQINEIRGFEKTFFQIEILTVKGHTFTGKVQDDLATGGTEGVGEISGTIEADRMDFIKSMPVMTLLVDRQGTLKTYNKKHRPIFYSGHFSSDGETVSGTWRFKFGFIWMGIFPVPMMPAKGTWSMTRKKS